MESLENTYASILEETYRHFKVVRDEIDKADREGRDVAHVIAEENTQRGDIIEISRFPVEGEESDEDAEEFKARVLSVMPRVAVDENGVQVHCVEALCVILKPGDVASLDDFAAMYGDEGDEPQEALEDEDSDSVDQLEDPSKCPCGADLQMCATNQKVFGGHLND